MKKARKWQRILILCFLSFTVFAPIFFLSSRLKLLTRHGMKEFVEDLSTIKYRAESMRLNSMEEAEGEGLKEPNQLVYQDEDLLSLVSYGSSNVSDDADLSRRTVDRDLHLQSSEDFESAVNPTQQNGTDSVVKEDTRVIQHEKAAKGENQDMHMGKPAKEEVRVIQQEKTVKESIEKGLSNLEAVSQHENVPIRKGALDVKLKEMIDQLVRARIFLSMPSVASNSRLVKEIQQRIKDLERAMGKASKDSDLSRSASQKRRAMDSTLRKAQHLVPDCTALDSKLRTLNSKAIEQLQAHKNEKKFLLELAGRTTPKGLHCLSMRLTTEYFSLPLERRKVPDQQGVHDPSLFHYAVVSDNVLASAVVVNSTVSSAMNPERIFFHVVTDSLNLPAFRMWFLLFPPGKAAIQIQSIQEFENLFVKHDSSWKHSLHVPRHSSALNHLRFYLPDVFSKLNKVVLFDHDVVVRRDLTGLWYFNMRGKVNGAVETCHENKLSFRKMDWIFNFSEPFVAKSFDANACTWASGMNVIDLQQWRIHNLSDLHHKYIELGSKKPLWQDESLALSLAVFYNQTVALDKRWHVLGLGDESGADPDEIEKGAMLHYNGVRKPWLDIANASYKSYWNMHIDYNHPYLQQCNIHP